jgi:hypothetical protein
MPMDRFLIKKLRHKYIWRKVFYERLTEPLHLNVLSAFVAVFGGFRSKVAFDLIVRPQHAFAILKCADEAVQLGLRKVSLLEFGVASGAGLLNICKIAERVTRITGVEFEIAGFDTGGGLPPPASYLDHPDLYQEGDFPMGAQTLARDLPPHARLLLGDVAETVPQFLEQVTREAPIGFVSLDLDYYSSTKDALRVLRGESQKYLPRTLVYVDDIQLDSHNSWCGPLLAIHEFNDEQKFRKIEHHAFLENQRVFRNARWIKQIFTLHVLDHPTRSSVADVQRSKQTIENPYFLSAAGQRSAAGRSR